MKPISQRYTEIIKEREEKVKELGEKIRSKREKEVEKELTFKPKVTNNRKTREKMNSKEFFLYNQKWKREKLEETERERQKTLARCASDVTLKPDINEKSRKLAKNTPLERRFIEYEERKKEKLEELRRELEPTFHPVISLKSQEIVKRKATTPPAFRRLYSPKKKRVEKEDMEDVEVEVVEPEWSGVPTVYFRLDTQ